MWLIGGSGAQVTLTKIVAAADIANVNLSVDNGTCTGLTAAPTSTNTRAGSAQVAVAQVTSIGGPGLGLDTEDVTTHDQATAFEEVVSTLLRSGEISLDIVYDPNGTTHSAAAGLIDFVENKTTAYLALIFPGPYEWSFVAYVTGFEPSAAGDGALTATVKLKLTGQPTLA